MKYNKPALSIRDQVKTLHSRGLIINDYAKAEHYLSNISFYRLRAYTYPFQDNANPDHPFIKEMTFDDIIRLYVFDRKLRLLILDAIEKIEISLRTKIIYEFSMRHGSHWYCNENLYRSASVYDKHLREIYIELNRSEEDFIKHYDSKYTEPSYPPSWMTLEIVSFGFLSKLFKNLKWDCGSKMLITKYYGLKDIATLENWMHCFANIRNVCAHHSRVWNRRHMPIQLLNKPIHPFPKTEGIFPYRTYAYLCSILYVLNIINPENNFKTKLKDLITFYSIQERDMGFPEGWLMDSFWS